MNYIRSIKHAYQRVVRGYDDTLIWSYADYLNNTIPALKRFCWDELSKDGISTNNPKRAEIYQRTLELIKAFETMPYEDYFKTVSAESELWEYVGKNVGWFWD